VRELWNADNRGDVVLTKLGMCSIAVLLVGAAALAGCSADSDALDDAYALGFADGVASVQQESPDGGSYARGYQDGVAEALSGDAGDACGRCYGLGFSEGYEAGLSAAAQ